MKSARFHLLALLVSGLVGTSQAAAQSVTPENAAAPTAAPQALVGRTDSVWNNLMIFAGLDGSKQPQDLGINANMGVRFSANLGLPLSRKLNLGAQIGVGQNLSDAAVHVLDQIEGTSSRRQTFVSAGLFQTANRLNWGLGYDMLVQQYYDDFTLGQVRGFAGFDVTEADELGLWFTRSARGETGTMGGTNVHLEPVSQVNAYFARTWSSGSRTRLWVGMAAGHHNVVWVLPDNSQDRNVLVYGADLELPLNDRFAVSGSANFLTPTATGTVDAFLGVTYFPGKKADYRSRGAFAPAQAVANNPEFPVNMSR